VDAATGKTTPIGKPAMFTNIDPAPDGDHILVTFIKKPFSYVTTYDRFAHDVEVWTRNGKSTPIAQLPVADRVAIHGVPTGPRGFEWRATEPATLIWAEALDRGDWSVKVPQRDKVMTQSAPFTKAAEELTRVEQRYAGFRWTEKRNLALLGDYDHNKHWRRTWVVNVDDAKTRPSLLWDMSSEESYKDPGNPVYKALPNGEWVVQLDGDAIFLDGEGATPEGTRPFLDRLDVRTRKMERLFRSSKDSLEYFVAFTDETHRNLL